MKKEYYILGAVLVVSIIVSIFLLTRKDMSNYVNVLNGDGYDHIASSIELGDNHFVAVGYTDSTSGDLLAEIGGRDGLIMKFNHNNEIVWTKTYGSEHSDEFTYVLKLHDGNMVTIGKTRTYNGNSAGYIMKFDSDGNMIWDRTMSDYHLYSVIEMNDQSLILAGIKSDIGASLIKLDSNGETLWEKETDADSFKLLAKTNDDTIVAIGETYKDTTEGNDLVVNLYSPLMRYNLLIVEMDTNGVILNHKIHNLGFASFHSIIETQEGHYLIGGSISERNETSYLLIEVDKNGEIIWQKQNGTKKYDEKIEQMIPVSDGYITVGSKYDESILFTNSHEAWIAKFDLDGNMVWEQVIKRKLDENFYTVVQNENNLYALGTSREKSRQTDIIMVKYDKEGNIIKNN